MVKSIFVPERGDIIWISFGLTDGHEQNGRRPAFVVSPKVYNEKSGLAIVCPITAKKKGYPFEVELGEEKISGVVLVDQARSIDWQARQTTFISKAGKEVTRGVQEKLSLLIL